MKTIDFIHMKPLYWAIRDKSGVLDGMIRRVPRMKDRLREAWNKEFENEDLDTVLKQFETKLQSLPNPQNTTAYRSTYELNAFGRGDIAEGREGYSELGFIGCGR